VPTLIVTLVRRIYRCLAMDARSVADTYVRTCRRCSVKSRGASVGHRIRPAALKRPSVGRALLEAAHPGVNVQIVGAQTTCRFADKAHLHVGTGERVATSHSRPAAIGQ